MREVMIDREPRNKASARVAEKLGAKETGARLVEHDGSEVELVRNVITRPRD
jgi:RimJ/RimL family protein N-acetyltransferase